MQAMQMHHSPHAMHSYHQGQTSGAASSMITQVQRGNTVSLLADLPPDVKAALLSGINMSAYPKFGKEPLGPPHAALGPQKP